MKVVFRIVCVAAALLTMVSQSPATTAGHLLRSATTPPAGLEQPAAGEQDVTGSIRTHREKNSDITGSIKRKRAPAIRPVQPANPAAGR